MFVGNRSLVEGDRRAETLHRNGLVPAVLPASTGVSVMVM
jgi:hypothetical protein